jgi:hypothetical protein
MLSSASGTGSMPSITGTNSLGTSESTSSGEKWKISRSCTSSVTETRRTRNPKGASTHFRLVTCCHMSVSDSQRTVEQ